MVREEREISADAVRAEPGRILASPHFDASERNRRLLTFAVEEALAGRTHRIKACAMLARWDEALPLLDESYAVNRAQPGSYRIGLFLYHFAHGRFAEALTEARRVDAPKVLYGHVAAAAAAAELGLDEEAADAVAAIRGLEPDYGAHVTADLESRHVAPDLVSRIVAGLGKARLPIAALAPDEPAS